MQMEWQGYYFDGQTPARQHVTIRLTPIALLITTEKGVHLQWAYKEVRQTQGFYAGEQIRLEKGGEIPEVLLLTDTAFLTALRRFAPQHAAQFHNPTSRRWRVQLTIIAAVVVIGLTTALYLWGIPAVVALVAPRVPVSWEEQLGQVVVAQLAPPEQFSQTRMMVRSKLGSGRNGSDIRSRPLSGLILFLYLKNSIFPSPIKR